jgi:Xaa-Pro aminopeptidase
MKTGEFYHCLKHLPSIQTKTMTINERIDALRAQMRGHGVDAYIVPSSDPHQSEYVADHWKVREWLSGFTGSAGTLIVTADHAGLWTDSRYFLQAERELQAGEVELHKQRVPHAPEHVSWLAGELPPGSAVGCNGFLFSVGQIAHLERTMAKHHIDLVYDLNLIGDIWEDRPPLPKEEIFEYDVEYAGKSREDKLREIREQMLEQEALQYLITTLDDIAWTLNLRGNDVAYNPVFISYLLIGDEKAFLFIDEEKVSEEIRKRLKEDGVALRDYYAVMDHLETLPEETAVLVDPRTINRRLFDAIREEQRVKGDNIPRRLKAIKNRIEVEHLRRVMVKDGVALVKLYRWLEAALPNRTVTEFEVARQLDHFRSAQGDYHGESFGAIVGYDANGAIVHYRPSAETSAALQPKGLLLLDSGGQYVDGTTDITRTTALGESTEEQRRHYTLVLKGHIALATIHFPEGTTGGQLDTLARMYLWRAGLNYGHGTGHGVGFFLNVHEPPQGFASSNVTPRGTTAFEPGMLTSNEPGFYKDGAYGIRIENLVLCMEGEETDYGRFLKFETLTLFPIDLSLVEESLLTKEERAWLNQYHQEVFEKLSAQLNPEEVEWLERKCRPVG